MPVFRSTQRCYEKLKFRKKSSAFDSQADLLCVIVKNQTANYAAFFSRYPVLLQESVILTITSFSTLIGIFIGTLWIPDNPKQEYKITIFLKRLKVLCPCYHNLNNSLPIPK